MKTNEQKEIDAREAAFDKYSSGDSMDVCLSRASYESFEAGWSAAKEFYQPKWVRIDGPEDLPKETGEYSVTIKGPSGLSVTTMRFYGFWDLHTEDDRVMARLRRERWLPNSTWYAIAWKELDQPYQPEETK